MVRLLKLCIYTDDLARSTVKHLASSTITLVSGGTNGRVYVVSCVSARRVDLNDNLFECYRLSAFLDFTQSRSAGSVGPSKGLSWIPWND